MLDLGFCTFESALQILSLADSILKGGAFKDCMAASIGAAKSNAFNFGVTANRGPRDSTFFSASDNFLLDMLCTQVVPTLVQVSK